MSSSAFQPLDQAAAERLHWQQELRQRWWWWWSCSWWRWPNWVSRTFFSDTRWEKGLNWDLMTTRSRTQLPWCPQKGVTEVDHSREPWPRPRVRPPWLDHAGTEPPPGYYIFIKEIVGIICWSILSRDKHISTRGREGGRTSWINSNAAKDNHFGQCVSRLQIQMN